MFIMLNSGLNTVGSLPCWDHCVLLLGNVSEVSEK